MKKTLSDKALEVIAAYKDMPYYNNKRQNMRLGLPALIGKGTAEEIADEALLYALKEKVQLGELTPEQKKKFLVDHHLGVDCSAFAYYVLDAESQARGLGSLSKSLAYPFSNGFFARLNQILRGRYVERADVRTFAHSSNSHEVQLSDVQPGDFAILLIERQSDEAARGIRNHIQVVISVTSSAAGPDEIELAQSVALPSDGKYGHGVRIESMPLSELRLPIHRLNRF